MPTRNVVLLSTLPLSAFLLMGPLVSKPKLVVPKLSQRSVKIIRVGGLPFKDLNKNGRLDAYEDWRKSPKERAADLLQRMSTEEKAGVMMHGTAPANGPAGMGNAYDLGQAGRLIRGAKVNTFITRLSGNANDLAAENNKLQEIAEGERLGIPLTISTDPRNQFHFTTGASVAAGSFSQWPGPLGLAAVRDAALTRRFGDIARQEYMAVGIREALSPQADLATEPRWSRIDGTFGEDAELAKQMVRAYVEGFQHGGNGLNRGSVLTVVKHWVGYGAQKNGLDSHNAYGRYAEFPNGSLDYHILPFTGAFAAKVAAVMPTYSILEGARVDGKPLEQVGAGFNAQLLTLLRRVYGFEGVIVSDWAITNDCPEICMSGFPAGQKPNFSAVGMPWGVERLSKEDRFAKAINAGVDQIGGTEDTSVLLSALHARKISQQRIDEAVLRILTQKFQQGLFEDPYVDSGNAVEVVASTKFQAEALNAQRRSLVLLENKDKLLPLNKTERRIFLYQVDARVASQYGFTVTDNLENADLALLRVSAPYETLHPNYLFGSMQHEGSLDFAEGGADWEMINRAAGKVPTIVTIYLDRPAILTKFNRRVGALLANFGASDRALFDVITGKGKPEGRLPFELPSSMQEVEAQASELPHDTAHPLYKLGFGLTY
jgi:beta-glucosidase